MKQFIVVLCVLLSMCVLGDEGLMTNRNSVVDCGDAEPLCEYRAEHQAVTNNYTIQNLPFDHEKIRKLVLAGSRAFATNNVPVKLVAVSKAIKSNKGKGKGGIVATLAVMLVSLWIILFKDYPMAAIVGGIVIVIVIVSSAIFIKQKRESTDSPNQPRVE